MNLEGSTQGERLSVAQKRAGLKNAAIAEAAGVHVKTVSYWRNDKQSPQEEQLDAVVRLLHTKGVSVSRMWIRYGDEGPGKSLGREERVWLLRFRLRLVELDLSDEQVVALEALVHAPEVTAAYAALSPGEDVSTTQAMQWLGDLVVGEAIERTSRANGRRRRGQ